jgi:hypothetical protein
LIPVLEENKQEERQTEREYHIKTRFRRRRQPCDSRGTGSDAGTPGLLAKHLKPIP